MPARQDALFDLPPTSRTPRARVVLLAGPSGSGKTSLTRRLGLPVVKLDEFYRDASTPHLPHGADGRIDWDLPETWDAQAALAALTELAFTGASTIPIYSIPLSRRTGDTRLELGEHSLFVAEGIFASRLVAPARAAGILADAICIRRSRWKNYWFRLLRDLAEARKSVPELLRRGLRLARREPGLVRQWIADGCRPLDVPAAEAALRALLGSQG
ncbi:ATP-binding protein [Buchananella hordeovulneris]|uniref:ATP-binding protein n=1 Tax=Buchananella hordeovulneris TaxID=52770 RepID=UPI0026DC60BE|nr:ATP-binding protein [Buchananella hordeovulneris]MDO5080479.1 ATP-binding protein [Buchananella hordeovulneris]